MKTRRLLIALFLVLSSAGLSFADALVPPEAEKKPGYIIPAAVVAVCVIVIALIIKRRKK